MMDRITVLIIVCGIIGIVSLCLNSYSYFEENVTLKEQLNSLETQTKLEWMTRAQAFMGYSSRYLTLAEDLTGEIIDLKNEITRLKIECGINGEG